MRRSTVTERGKLRSQRGLRSQSRSGAGAYDEQHGDAHDHLSIHDQVDPAVGDVVITFHEPVVSGVVRADDLILHAIPNEVIIGLDETGESLPDIERGTGIAEVLRDDSARVVAGRLVLICTVHRRYEVLKASRIGLDLTGGFIVLDDKSAHVLFWMRGVVLIEDDDPACQIKTDPT